MILLSTLVIAFFARQGQTGAATGETLLTRRPDLGVYQDVTMCAYPGSTWYMMYRNNDDHDFGQSIRCYTETQTTEVVDGKARFNYRYGPGYERNATVTFKSSPGQSYKNVFQGQPDGGSSPGAEYEILYVHCDKCKILRRRESTKCYMLVREAAFRFDVQRCHFIFDLLCGPAPKYLVSDASCLEGAKKG